MLKWRILLGSTLLILILIKIRKSRCFDHEKPRGSRRGRCGCGRSTGRRRRWWGTPCSAGRWFAHRRPAIDGWTRTVPDAFAGQWRGEHGFDRLRRVGGVHGVLDSRPHGAEADAGQALEPRAALAGRVRCVVLGGSMIQLPKGTSSRTHSAERSEKVSLVGLSM